MHQSEILLTDLSNSIKSKEISVIQEPDKYLHILEKHFPIEHQKINWNELDEVIEVNANLGDYYKDAMAFFNFVCTLKNLKSEVIVFNDGSYDYSLSMKIDVLKKYMLRLLEEPQNTYILPVDLSWCMAFTMEHRFNFGYLSTKN